MKKFLFVAAISLALYSSLTGCKSTTSPSAPDTTKTTFDSTTLHHELLGSWTLSKVDSVKAPVGYTFFIQPYKLAVLHDTCRAVFNTRLSHDTMFATKYQDSCGLIVDVLPGSQNTWSISGTKLTIHTGLHTYELTRPFRNGMGLEAASGHIIGIKNSSGLWPDFMNIIAGNAAGPFIRIGDPSFPFPYDPYITFQKGTYTNCYFATDHNGSVSQYGWDLYIVAGGDQDGMGQATVWMGDGVNGAYSTVSYSYDMLFDQWFLSFSSDTGDQFLNGLTLVTGSLE